MRKFTFLLAFLAFTAMAFAQQATIRSQESVNETFKTMTPSDTKSYGDVYWSEDFDGANWSSTVETWNLGYQLNPSATLPVHEDGGTWKIVDNLDMNYFWHWSDVGTRGAYSKGEDGDCHTPDPLTITRLPEGTSTENGFMLFEADYFNTTENCVISSGYQPHDSYMLYGPIDFSDKPGAIFNVKTYYRYCCSSDSRLVVQFSTDYDMGAGTGTWGDEYRINTETPNNSYTYTSERDFSVNVSADVVGQSNVYFKISIINASHYFTYIDDIKFIEPPVNDLVVSDNWALYMYDTEDPDYTAWSDAKYDFFGGYTQIPVSLVKPFVKFKAAATNNGTADAENAKANVKIYKNNVLDLNVSGDPITIAKYAKDTVRVVTDYTPTLGAYQVSMTVTMDAVDQDQSNNNWGYDFEVGTNVYSRVYHGQEANFSSAGPRDWASGGYDGDIIAQLYDVPTGTSVLLKGLSVYMDNYRGADAEIAAIEAGEFAMIGKVFYDDLETGETVNTGIATDIYIVQIDDTATWVDLDFVDEGNLLLEGGETLQYYMAIETYTGTEQVLRFEVGTDISIKQPHGNGGYVYLSSQGGWYTTGDNYAIDMMLDIVNDSVNVTFNVDMTNYSAFDAATEKVYVNGTFGDELELSSTDDVNYTGTVKVGANASYTYKYSTTNSTEDAIRQLLVGNINYFTHDDYDYTSIDANKLAKVAFYPNPVNNELNITGLENVEMVIISNVVGQTIMTIPANNARTISTANLSKGIYMITFVDAANNMRTERIVKQ